MRGCARLAGPALALLLANFARAEDPGFAAAREEVARRAGAGAIEGRARNAVLFVGDGLGLSTVVAARILAGQRAGGSGEESRLAFERLPWSALARTHSVDRQTPDSAAAMTALMSGVKTRSGVVGLDAGATRELCRELESHKAASALELAERAGLATGVVTTARLTDATPAATYAHAPDRRWEDDSALPEAARAAGCLDIAAQLVDFPHGDGIEIALGGGRARFLPRAERDPALPGVRGRRRDGRNLAAEWSARPGSSWIWSSEQLAAADPTRTRHLLGLFAPSHLRCEADRGGASGEPSLSEMTARALDFLARGSRGFLLVVEAGNIDHAHHDGNAQRALLETLELSRAVEVALQRTDERDTLLVVTADHAHALLIGGPGARSGNPVLGLVEHAPGSPVLDLNGLPFAMLAYANGPGAGRVRHPPRARGGRPDLRTLDTQLLDFRQEALVPLERAGHSAEDVPVWARGPAAHLLRGSIEQREVFHVLVRALGLTTGAAVPSE